MAPISTGAARYDPTRAGFTTPDTYRQAPPVANLGLAVDPLTRNTYNYVNGDPINYSDPSGHEPYPHHNPNAGKQRFGTADTSRGGRASREKAKQDRQQAVL